VTHDAWMIDTSTPDAVRNVGLCFCFQQYISQVLISRVQMIYFSVIFVISFK